MRFDDGHQHRFDEGHDMNISKEEIIAQGERQAAAPVTTNARFKTRRIRFFYAKIKTG